MKKRTSRKKRKSCYVYKMIIRLGVEERNETPERWNEWWRREERKGRVNERRQEELWEEEEMWPPLTYHMLEWMNGREEKRVTTYICQNKKKMRRRKNENHRREQIYITFLNYLWARESRSGPNERRVKKKWARRIRKEMLKEEEKQVERAWGRGERHITATKRSFDGKLRSGTAACQNDL